MLLSEYVRVRCPWTYWSIESDTRLMFYPNPTLTGIGMDAQARLYPIQSAAHVALAEDGEVQSLLSDTLNKSMNLLDTPPPERAWKRVPCP